MSSLFCVISHDLTEAQKEDIKLNFNVTKIITLPKDKKQKWMQIIPYDKLNLKDLDLIANWLEQNAHPKDYVLVQGEFGATFYIVDFCFNNKLVPIYATSYRRYSEEIAPNDTIERKHVFKHVQFRRYIRWNESDE